MTSTTSTTPTSTSEPTPMPTSTSSHLVSGLETLFFSGAQYRRPRKHRRIILLTLSWKSNTAHLTSRRKKVVCNAFVPQGTCKELGWLLQLLGLVREPETWKRRTYSKIISVTRPRNQPIVSRRPINSHLSEIARTSPPSRRPLVRRLPSQAVVPTHLSQRGATQAPRRPFLQDKARLSS